MEITDRMDDDMTPEERQQAQAEAFDAALSWVLEDPRGRSVLRRLLQDCAPLDPCTLTGGVVDYYRLGRRDLGALWFRRIETVNPGGIANLLKEQDNV